MFKLIRVLVEWTLMVSSKQLYFGAVAIHSVGASKFTRQKKKVCPPNLYPYSSMILYQGATSCHEGDSSVGVGAVTDFFLAGVYPHAREEYEAVYETPDKNCLAHA